MAGACDQAALAALASSALGDAEDRGVDYPEIIEIAGGGYEPQRHLLELVSQGRHYRIQLGAVGRHCSATLVSVSARH